MLQGYDSVEFSWNKDDLDLAFEQANEASKSSFFESVSQNLGVVADGLALHPSGREALAHLLKKIPKGKGYVPAFTCPVIKEIVEREGFTCIPYDFASEPGIFDWDQLISGLKEDASFFMVTHYYGVPVDFRPLLAECRKLGIAVIEDCAHTWGGLIEDEKVGGLGDASIFSFNYDKPIGLGWGGMSWVNPDGPFCKGEEENYELMSVEDERDRLGDFYISSIEKRAFIPNRNRFLYRRVLRSRRFHPKVFSIDPAVGMGPVQCELGKISISRYSKVSEIRNKRAKEVSKLQFETWPTESTVQPMWLRQKVRFPVIADLSSLIRRFNNHGFRIGNFNWPELPDTYRDHLVSKDASLNWYDVPVHQNIPDERYDFMLALLRDFDG